jgi:hypothetical protein
MNVYIEGNRVIEHPKFSGLVDTLTFKRGDKVSLNIYFCSEGSIVAPVSGRNIVFGVKPSGVYDSASFIVHADTPTIVSDHYVLSPNFNTAELNALLKVDSLSTNDLAGVSLQGEFTWSNDNATWESSNTLEIIVINDVIRNTESTPLALPTPEQWLATYGLSPLVLTSPPLSSVLASVTVNPTLSANDTVKYTHKAGGTAGNFFYTLYSPGTDTTLPAFEYNGTTGITVRYAPRAYVTVTGAGNAAYNKTYRYDSEENGKPMWLNEDVTYIRLAYTEDYEWAIYSEDNELQYKTNNAPNWPELGTWIQVDGTAPAPTTITKHNSTAADLVNWLGNYPTVANLITAEVVSGDGSGYVGTVGLSAFSGGVNGTAGVFGQDAIVNHADVYKCVNVLPYKWTKLN